MSAVGKQMQSGPAAPVLADKTVGTNLYLMLHSALNCCCLDSAAATTAVTRLDCTTQQWLKNCFVYLWNANSGWVLLMWCELLAIWHWWFASKIRTLENTGGGCSNCSVVRNASRCTLCALSNAAATTTEAQSEGCGMDGVNDSAGCISSSSSARWWMVFQSE